QERDAAAARVNAARDAFAAVGPEARDALAAAGSADDGATGGLDAAALSRTGRDWDAELVRLDAAVEDEHALSRLDEEYRREQEAAEELDRRATAIATRAEGLPDRIATARADLDRAEEAVRSLGGLRDALDAARSVED